MTLKILDLFSGIGGFSLGLEATGHFETKAFCEIEPYCQQILKKHWPEVPIFNDIRTLKGTDIGTIDIITGGYPCQPFSVAGKQKAEQDPRHLWPEYFRLIQELKPTWVIGENVSGHIKLGLDSVLEDLASEGYSTRTFSISASSIGANHKRERVWTIANLADTEHTRSQNQSWRRFEELENQSREKEKRTRDKSTVCFETSSSNVANSESIGKTGIRRETESKHDIRNTWMESERSSYRQPEHQTLQDVADTKSISRNEHETDREHGKTSSQEIPGNRGSIPRESTWWSSEPRVGRVAHGIPKRVDRLKSLGNAVVPHIPYYIGQAIIESYQ